MIYINARMKEYDKASAKKFKAVINISLDHREEAQLQTEEIRIATARQILVYSWKKINIHDQL